MKQKTAADVTLLIPSIRLINNVNGDGDWSLGPTDIHSGSSFVIGSKNEGFGCCFTMGEIIKIVVFLLPVKKPLFVYPQSKKALSTSPK